MIDYIKGSITELTPAQLILECYGIGYSIEISLQTYEELQTKTTAQVYIHHYIREDEELYYGFATKDERELFRLLISVSGIGVNTARMMLSSLSSNEIREAILSENTNKIKSIKGIGLKSAQRLILELKDKVVKGDGMATEITEQINNSAIIEEAARALVMLGFAKPNVNKVLQKIIKDKPSAKVEELIKDSLKML